MGYGTWYNETPKIHTGVMAMMNRVRRFYNTSIFSEIVTIYTSWLRPGEQVWGIYYEFTVYA